MFGGARAVGHRRENCRQHYTRSKRARIHQFPGGRKNFCGIRTILPLECRGRARLCPIHRRAFSIRRAATRAAPTDLFAKPEIALNPDKTKMRVLQLAPRVCWPLDTGAKLRNYHLARVLSSDARVTLLAFGDSSSNAELRDVYDEVVTVPRGSGYSLGKLLRGAVGRTPLPLLNYTSQEMTKAVSRLFTQKEFDVVQVESIHLMNYLRTIRASSKRALVICDWHNIESELMQRYSEQEPSAPRRAYARRTARLMKDLEQRALSEFDAHIAVSERDAEALRSVNLSAKVFVIENGVDSSYYEPDGSGSNTRNRIVFVGSMDYHANVEGVVKFARNVWPAVHQQKPELVFTIVGKDPAPAVRELSSINGVEVTGSVDDVRRYYREAVAAVVPLNVGGGSRLKILEAMAAGVPVVSSTLGAEGLDVRDGENILIANAEDRLTKAVIDLVNDEKLRARLVSGGHALVGERYDWTRLGAKLSACYRHLLSERG
jgi:polysaccharide biosynthesis protein PslH